MDLTSTYSSKSSPHSSPIFWHMLMMTHLKAKFTLFFLICFMLSLHAQNRFVYELKSVRDTIAKNALTEVYFLDINKNNVKFFSRDLYEVDSTQIAEKEFNSSMTLGYSLMLRRNLNSIENENFSFVDTDYFTYPSTDEIIWKISDDISYENTYSLQKATTTFGGRNWVAWFSKDIPLNEGPYKFKGLPGLIFQIEDDKKHYSFKLLEVLNLPKEYDTARILETNFGKKPLPISLKKYNEILLNAYNNPYAEIRVKLERGDKYTFAAHGRQIRSVRDLDEIRKIVQEQKRKNYNPLELDKAVNYGQ